MDKGLNLNIVKKISKIKSEPKWMLDLRIEAFNFFRKIKNPS
jgi:Fe-S cluster assembly protein SufB